jgi:hypothetical protein
MLISSRREGLAKREFAANAASWGRCCPSLTPTNGCVTHAGPEERQRMPYSVVRSPYGRDERCAGF